MTAQERMRQAATKELSQHQGSQGSQLGSNSESELKALLPLLSKFVEQQNQIQAEQVWQRQQMERLGKAMANLLQQGPGAAVQEPEQPEWAKLLAAEVMALRRENRKLIGVWEEQASLQVSSTRALTQSLNGLDGDRKRQATALESLSRAVEGKNSSLTPNRLNSMLNQALSEFAARLPLRNNSNSEQWGWGGVTVAVLAGVMWMGLISWAVSEVAVYRFREETEAYLYDTWKRAGWANTKLQRIEEHLGTEPKREQGE